MTADALDGEHVDRVGRHGPAPLTVAARSLPLRCRRVSAPATGTRRGPTADRPRDGHHGRGGACRICAARAAPGFSTCTSCRAVAVSLGRPLVPVTPVAVVARPSPLYRALRQYKSGEPEVAARQSARLVSLLDRFFARHVECIAPGGLDLCVVVPSPYGARPPPHPLAALVAASRSLPPLVDALFPGTSPVAHRRPSADGYRATNMVSGRRVLLVDDVYTSGAHLQSAAVALAAAGAEVVRAVVLGRFVRDDAPRLRCPRCRR